MSDGGADVTADYWRKITGGRLPAEPVEPVGREGGEDLPHPLLRRLGGGIDRLGPRLDRAVERLGAAALLLLVPRLVRRRLAGAMAPGLRLTRRGALTGPV